MIVILLGDMTINSFFHVTFRNLSHGFLMHLIVKVITSIFGNFLRLSLYSFLECGIL